MAAQVSQHNNLALLRFALCDSQAGCGILATMSHNEELARQLIAALNRQDWDAVAEIVSPDFEWHTPKEGTSGSRIFDGVEGLQAFWETDITDAWDLSESRDEIEEAFDLGPNLLVAKTHSYDVGRSSGAIVEHHGGAIVDFRNSKIRRVRIYLSAEDALKEARQVA
jgi:ketosteroid isomerase-like protein